MDVVRINSANEEILIRFSESIKEESVKPETIILKEGTNTISGTTSFEDESKVIRFKPETFPKDVILEIVIKTDIEDLNGNKLEEEFTQTFTYIGFDLIIYDRKAPEVELIKLISNEFYIVFNEEIDESSISESVELTYFQGTINGETSLEEAKTIKFTPSKNLSTGVEYKLTIKTDVKDLSGKNLAESVIKQFIYQGVDLIILDKPSPNEKSESFIGNTYLFQGREYDLETGLYYYRARYLHPELGRFLQGDPKGYIDSMNLYQVFNQNSINFIDPYGKIIVFSGKIIDRLMFL